MSAAGLRTVKDIQRNTCLPSPTLLTPADFSRCGTEVSCSVTSSKKLRHSGRFIMWTVCNQEQLNELLNRSEVLFFFCVCIK